MQIIDLGFHGEARVWLEETLFLSYPALDLIEKDIKIGLRKELESSKTAILEVLFYASPRFFYGLLGVEFVPNNTGKLSIQLKVSTENENLYTNSIAKEVDTVRVGLPEEYAQSVIDGIMDSLTEANIELFGSGLIQIEQAAHAEISSSNKTFRNIAATAIQLLLLDRTNSEKEETAEVVKNYIH